MAWCAFVVLWFAQAFSWVMFVLWTTMFVAWHEMAYDSSAEVEVMSLSICLFLTVAMIITTAGCAVAWVFVLVDASGYVLPRCPGRRSS